MKYKFTIIYSKTNKRLNALEVMYRKFLYNSNLYIFYYYFILHINYINLYFDVIKF